MKIPKKRELQQTASNHSSAIDFEDFMNLYKKCTANPCSIVIDTTLTSDNPSRFNLLERIWQLIISLEMKNCNIILTENQQNNNNNKISALLSGKIDKYEHLEGEEILPSCRGQTIEQAMFTYSPLVKALEKQVICKILLKKKI